MNDVNIGDPRRMFLPTNPFLALVEDGNNLMDMEQEAAAVMHGAVPRAEGAPPRFNFKLPCGLLERSLEWKTKQIFFREMPVAEKNLLSFCFCFASSENMGTP